MLVTRDGDDPDRRVITLGKNNLAKDLKESVSGEDIREGIVACNSVGELTLLHDLAAPFADLPPDSVPADRWANAYDFYHADGKTPLSREEIPLFRALRGEHVQNLEMVMTPRRHGCMKSLAG